MEGRGSSGGGCCIARYTPHVPSNNNIAATTTTAYPYYYTNDVSKMDRIMLRFRPIAPKPDTSGPNSSGSTESVAPTSGGKRKRKPTNNTNKASTTNDCSKRRKSSRSPDDQKSVGSSSNGRECCHVVTLPLLPETPDLSPTNNNNNNDNNNNNIKNYSNNNNNIKNNKICSPTWLCFGPTEEERAAQNDVVQSKVTIEGVSDAWLKENVVGRTDKERTRMLEEDTCPGFISDTWNRVRWTNKEYRKMVSGDGKEKAVAVRVEMREGVELLTTAAAAGRYGAFTCRVRVQYGVHSMVVPCDVWRMSGGGFAWRLDVKAALSLSL